MFKDKLFFFGAQEWVNFYRDQTAIITVPTAAMRNGDFSELLNPSQRLLQRRARSSTIPRRASRSRAT